MNKLHAGRRTFLGNIALLSAGVALSGVTATMLSANDNPDLETVWKKFCKLNKAGIYAGVLENRKNIVPCKGHAHKEGIPVYFSDEKVIAQPVWIYWANNRSKPADVVVNFYREDNTVTTINQFEMRSLSGVNRTELNEAQKSLSALLKVNSRGHRSLVARTTISNNKTKTITIST